MREPASVDVAPARLRYFVLLKRQGQIRRRVVTDVTGATLKAAIREEVGSRTRIVTDELTAYKGLDQNVRDMTPCATQ
jgi:transposase-like protein